LASFVSGVSDSKNPIELSFEIPVFNGDSSIGPVVSRIHSLFTDLTFEVVLVNDGSKDESEKVCRGLVESHPDSVTFVHLARNFGEHNAVLAGLNHSRGAYVAVLDDDGQNPPEEVRKLYDCIRARKLDVVFGHYRIKHHSTFRNLGSWFNGWVANIMIKKPPELYLSSFKIMNRFMVNEIAKYCGAFPYIDGLILRSSANLGQIEVEHREAPERSSNYNLTKLFKLWLNMFLNFSILPLRIAALLGVVTAVIGLLLLGAIVADKLYFNPDVPVGIPTVLITIVFFAGVQLVILGTIGEYLGRLFMDHSGSPQFVVRYVIRAENESE